ncbi:hypothetical protein BKA56DRAFT_659455 [Ilyonectria sp. MPI-CAGE-AT-0026]|nr:hypothetical protein BKA56DRAFT_659455 [Ilyonectria sp. MPI-CAGE-AT-0026]
MPACDSVCYWMVTPNVTELQRVVHRETAWWFHRPLGSQVEVPSGGRPDEDSPRRPGEKVLGWYQLPSHLLRDDTSTRAKPFNQSGALPEARRRRPDSSVFRPCATSDSPCCAEQIKVTTTPIRTRQRDRILNRDCANHLGWGRHRVRPILDGNGGGARQDCRHGRLEARCPALDAKRSARASPPTATNPTGAGNCITMRAADDAPNLDGEVHGVNGEYSRARELSRDLFLYAVGTLSRPSIASTSFDQACHLKVSDHFVAQTAQQPEARNYILMISIHVELNEEHAVTVPAMFSRLPDASAPKRVIFSTSKCDGKR